MDFDHSPKVQDLQTRVRAFMDEHIIPAEPVFKAEMKAFRAQGNPWQEPQVIEALKHKARAAGLWNLFLPESSMGAGLSNLEYAPLAEIMGRSIIGSEPFNCSAPDTGNMETIVRYGTPAQQERWLRPLLDGSIRSGFAMTEPAVASSDATNIETRLLNPGKEKEMLSEFVGRCDLVLIDAPCSGSGTWRRNPETRWRLDAARLKRVVEEQAKLLDIGSEMVARGGHIVYAVCSLIENEGKGQVVAFLKSHNGWRAVETGVSMGRADGDGVLLTPLHDGSDGFFFARLQKL